MTIWRLLPYSELPVAEELAAAPPQVRETVVTMLQGHFEVEDGAHLRRRCRRALARISPELLLERATRARAQCGLRRWVAEPGVDRWEGSFPSEDAATAWAAIDALAHRYVKDGVCTHIEAARGKALTDLVGELSTRSEQFRIRWARHDVRFHRTEAKKLRHPAVGDLDLTFEALELPADEGLTVLVYGAEPASPTDDALRLLASWAATVAEEPRA